MPASKPVEQIKRLTKMSWDEIRVRTRQEVCKRWDLAQSALALGRPRSEPSRGSVRGAFFLNQQEIAQCVKWFRAKRPDVVENTVAYAERLLNHQFDLLGYEGLLYGDPIDWHLDAVHGKVAPNQPWFRIPYLEFARVGDHKITWELNRHQHLVTLAKAYRFTGSARYAEELFHQWYHWREQNPCPYGINWASSLEIALRSLSWLWVWHLTASCDAVPAEFTSDLSGALQRNARHIERYLSTYFAPNTHLLGEAVGLFAIGSLVAGSPAARRWQERGWQIILQEAERQVRADGLHFEQSTYYHTYALDFFLHARILAERNHITIPKAFDATIEKMLKATWALANSGCSPQFGDDDGGRVFDGRRNGREHMTDPLAVGAALLNRGDFKTAAGDLTEETVWLLGTCGAARFESLPNSAKRSQSIALRSSGIYAMASAQPTRQRLLIEAGPQGMGWAGHGHADALSVQLDVDGKPVLIDPGTFTYVESSGERQRFRETRAHNTVEIDGVGQAEPAGPFKWKALADAKADCWITGQTFDLFSGSHPGYLRLSEPVMHRRYVFHVKAGFWLIRDVLEGTGAHLARFSWTFAPGSLRPVPEGFQFLGEGSNTLILMHAASANVVPQICEGWYSPRYGQKEKCPALRLNAAVRLPTECATALLPQVGAQSRAGRGLEALLQNQDCSVYRLKLGETVHEMVFANVPGEWKAGRIASDARFVCCAFSSGGICEHYVLCNGSYLKLNGETLFVTDVPVAAEEYSRKLSGKTRSHHLQRTLPTAACFS